MRRRPANLIRDWPSTTLAVLVIVGMGIIIGGVELWPSFLWVVQGTLVVALVWSSVRLDRKRRAENRARRNGL